MTSSRSKSMRRSPPKSLSDAALALAKRGEIGAVLHYSRRSTEIFLGLARQRRLSTFRGSTIFAFHMMRRRRFSMPESMACSLPKHRTSRRCLLIVNALAGLPKLPLGQGEE